MKKRVLITGGSGFVGRNLARLLPQYNFEVIAPTHSELDMIHLGNMLYYFQGAKIDAIIHCAFKGHFSSQNNHQDFMNNIQMYENLKYIVNNNLNNPKIPVIIMGSGAEFDRRFSIENAAEKELFSNWPVDLYGLSKNIIARRALGGELENPFVFRLFGCFGVDEPDFRFIKRSILRLKQGLPIEIQKDREMDFFFVEDIAQVINYILEWNSDEFRNMNLVYENSGKKRYSLSEIGEIICATMRIPSKIEVISEEKDNPYTGDGILLYKTNIPLVGLYRGICRMVKKLS